MTTGAIIAVCIIGFLVVCLVQITVIAIAVRLGVISALEYMARKDGRDARQLEKRDRRMDERLSKREERLANEVVAVPTPDDPAPHNWK